MEIWQPRVAADNGVMYVSVDSLRQYREILGAQDMDQRGSEAWEAVNDIIETIEMEIEG